jgi:hypothetical protein
MFHIVGENPEKLTKWHDSATINRTKAFAIAIHIPVLLWALTGYVIASTIFGLGLLASTAVATFCSLLIYMIERIVLATPKKWYVNVMRLLIGIVIAILGASTVDLVIFDKEVSYQLKKSEELRISSDFERQIAKQSQALLIKKSDWLKAQEAANCEANGECGSKTKSLGPIYKALKDQANVLQQDYIKAQSEFDRLGQDKAEKLEAAHNNVIGESGLLARIEALHQYTLENRAALVGWSLFFSLILFFELMVVLAKLVFSETVDDEIEKIRAKLAQNKAKEYLEALNSRHHSIQLDIQRALSN